MAKKIMTVNTDGDMRFEDEAMLMRFADEESDAIVQCKDVVERRKRWLRLGLLCERHGLEREAVDFYRSALSGAMDLKKKTEEYDICWKAYTGLNRLSESEDEYVWEATSETMHAYNSLFFK